MSDDAFSSSREAVRAELERRLREPAPGRIQVLTGPRQVGKTTMLLELVRDLPNAVYHAVDTPEAAVPGWWETIWRDIRQRQARGPTVVLLDEIQYLDKWDRLVKAKADQIRRERWSANVALSGSSALLRQLFLVCLGHPAEIVSLQKLTGELNASGALETVAHYLEILGQACLVAGLEKHSARVVRRRAAPPKIVVLNHGLMAASQDVFDGHPRWGSWVENACLAHAWNRGQEVRYWREEPLEVDGVLTGSWGKWAVEVKTGGFELRDLGGLLEFCRRFPEFEPLVLCSRERFGETLTGVRQMYWGDFLLGKPLPPRGRLKALATLACRTTIDQQFLRLRKPSARAARRPSQRGGHERQSALSAPEKRSPSVAVAPR